MSYTLTDSTRLSSRHPGNDDPIPLRCADVAGVRNPKEADFRAKKEVASERRPIAG